MLKVANRCPYSVLRQHAAFSTQMAKPIDFYHIPFSPPCRSVRMVAKLIGVDLNLIHVDLTKKEHLKPEFLKMNPQHKVPTMNDNGFVITESRAMVTYLCNKYAKDDSLYPKDPQKRAVVDQQLYFDMGTLYQPFVNYWYTCILGPAPIDQELLNKIYPSLEIFDKILEKSNFAAGDSLTVADCSTLAGISTFELLDIDVSKYDNIQKWLARCKEAVPDYEELNHKGAVDFKNLYNLLVSKKKQAQ